MWTNSTKLGGFLDKINELSSSAANQIVREKCRARLNPERAKHDEGVKWLQWLVFFDVFPSQTHYDELR